MKARFVGHGNLDAFKKKRAEKAQRKFERKMREAEEKGKTFVSEAVSHGITVTVDLTKTTNNPLLEGIRKTVAETGELQ